MMTHKMFKRENKWLFTQKKCTRQWNKLDIVKQHTHNYKHCKGSVVIIFGSPHKKEKIQKKSKKYSEEN